jgi:signal transduction histidine kinase/DNA-binding NarL/FixJ family response regulator
MIVVCWLLGPWPAPFLSLLIQLLAIANIVIIKGVNSCIPLLYRGTVMQLAIMSVGIIIGNLSNLRQKALIMSQKLAQKEKEKTLFFINTIHEIKTPLTLMKVYLNNFIENHKPYEDLVLVKENLDKIISDVTNYFDMEKINRGMELYKHDRIISVSRIIDYMTDLFENMAKQKKLTVNRNICKELYSKIDPRALDRIFNNLLFNSIKFTPDDGIIDITLHGDKEFIYLTIRDTGIGMDAAQQEHVFEPFYQISQTENKYQGMGMGLHIVKSILNEIGGSIQLDSKPESGSCFQIKMLRNMCLEIEQDQHVYPDIDIKTISGQSDMEIEHFPRNDAVVLFVDDNRKLLDYLANVAQKYYRVYTALDGLEALNLLKQIPEPDLIISDIMMDKMNGFELYKKLTDNEKYRGIPFVFLTARISPDDKIKGLANGAVDYIPKPFDIGELLAKMDAIISNKQIMRNKIAQSTRNEMLSEIKLNLKKSIDQTFEDNCRLFNFTIKEKEIVCMIKEGILNKEICWELKITNNTLRNHLKNIYKKTGAFNRIELANILVK